MQEHLVTEKKEKKEEQPTAINAFELISMSKGLNLENLFDIEQVPNMTCILPFLYSSIFALKSVINII